MTLSIHVSKISRKETSNNLLSILRTPLQLWEVAAPISHKYFTSFHSIPEPAELSLWGSMYLSSPSANRCRIVACPPPAFPADAQFIHAFFLTYLIEILHVPFRGHFQVSFVRKPAVYTYMLRRSTVGVFPDFKSTSITQVFKFRPCDIAFGGNIPST